MIDRRFKKEGETEVEALRIEKTTMSQEAFAKACGIPLRTYVRWIKGGTTPKLTVEQTQAVCNILGITKVKDIPKFSS